MVDQVETVAYGRDEKAKPIIRLEKLSKVYQMGKTQVRALRGVDLQIKRGEMVAIMGPSGSGKSTLMNILGCLDRPSSGNYYLDSISAGSMNKSQLADVRNQKIGFVFQSFNLLSWMSAQANVELPLIYAGVSSEEREQRARWALKLVGLGARSGHRPMEMSGGQQQRVAIARALATRPAMILADEPTGNLDSKTSIQIMMVLQMLNTSGMTIVLVTHEPDIASYCQRTVVLRDGKIREDTWNPQPLSAQAQLSEWSSSEGTEVLP
ncbi:ABC transporter ATP-binding protein [Dictyobacter arantiisoli]|uniref:Macrolide ABC transporter ATP-binding protein n=1 Tax=Dictyobacter arantiisoli TaxID=2014874 RepID=A0A5A5TBM0_9CHLR|nr:ABC transporter ATP-binding protein [Dictyobacter arantiisoli]GCF08757.1 macrolide ABC transporter ATP-binding protein [Dictyobacter arantiisoli]